MRKKIVFLLLLSPILVWAQEVNFHKNIPWNDALKMAKEQEKHIFVDAYTDWCYWCKVMDKNTFTDEKVIELLNDKFISVKLDAEKGEGINFASKFKIQGYPTVLFFTSGGKLVKKQPGYLPAEAFLEVANEVLEANQNIMVDGNNLNPGFPQFYIDSYNPEIKEKPEQEVIDAFLDQQKNIVNEVAWAVMFRFPLNEKHTSLFLSKKEELIKAFGDEEVNGKIERIGSDKLRAAIKNKSEKQLNETLKYVDEYFDDEIKENARQNFQVSYFKGIGEWQKFANLVNPKIKDANPNLINSYSWEIYEKCEDKKVINMACDWMAIAVEKESSYAILDTYAAVLFKAGKFNEAQNWANKAINQGKADGDDVKETEKLLENIKAKL